MFPNYVDLVGHEKRKYIYIYIYIYKDKKINK